MISDECVKFRVVSLTTFKIFAYSNRFLAIFRVVSLFVNYLSLISIACFIDNQNTIVLLKLCFIMRADIFFSVRH